MRAAAPPVRYVLLIGPNQRPFVRPRMRSAIALRWISDVPASIVFARERKKPKEQRPSAITRGESGINWLAGLWIASAKSYIRLFSSDHASLLTEPSGPGVAPL